jgi:hypothetical protein
MEGVLTGEAHSAREGLRSIGSDSNLDARRIMLSAVDLRSSLQSDELRLRDLALASVRLDMRGRRRTSDYIVSSWDIWNRDEMVPLRSCSILLKVFIGPLFVGSVVRKVVQLRPDIGGVDTSRDNWSDVDEDLGSMIEYDVNFDSHLR